MQQTQIFRISSTLGSNVYFVNTSPPVIIDTGNPSIAKDVFTLLSLNIPLPSVKHIFCTHSHPDHTGSAAALKRFTGGDILSLELKNDPKLTPAHTSSLNLNCEHFSIDRILKNGTTVELEDEQIRVIASPGHADDHCCLFFTKRKILFSGDLFTYNDTGFLNLNKHYLLSIEEFSNSIRRCQQTGAKIIYPGHGEPIYPDDKFWKRTERKLSLFRKNPLLLIPHTIISPLIFFLGTRELVSEKECEDYVVSHTYLFEGFLDDVSSEMVRSEFQKLISLLQFRDVLVRKNGLFLNSSPCDINFKWF